MNSVNYVDKHTIIKRVKQYYGLDASGKDVNDFIYDGLRGLGGFSLYDFIATSGINDMPDPIEVTSYKGTLPVNIEYPIQVFDYETKQPMSCVNSIFRNDYSAYSMVQSSKTYELKRNHIFTNIESHSVVLVYLGFPLDASGCPLVPDNENYLKALTAYVAKSIAFPLYLKGNIKSNIFSAIEQDYYAYSYGTSELEMPNIDQMEMLKNQMLDMLPDYNAYSSNFANLGKQSHIKYT